MRKVKLLALLLAALMVVAAFAGCANTEDIEKDVADLDDRVTALEGKIDANQKANEEQIKALTALVEALTKSQEEIKGSVEANKTAQDASNQAILDAINGLKDQIAEVEKEQADADKEAADKEAAEKDAAEKAKEEAAKLLAEQATAGAKLAALKLAADDKRADYFVDDFKALDAAIKQAEIDVAAAKTADEVKAVMAAVEAECAKYVAIDDQLYGYFTKLWNNITKENKAVNAEAQELIKLAKAHYDSALTAVESLTEYEYGKAADGSKLTVNLPAMLDAINDVCTGSSSISVKFLADNYDGLEGDVTVYSLAKAEAEAVKLDKLIKNFLDNMGKNQSYKYLMVTVYNTFTDLDAKYTDWCDAVLPLAEANKAMLTLASDLEAVKAIVDNYRFAVKALLDLGKYNYTTQATDDIFVINNYNGPVTKFYDKFDGKTEDFATKAIFAPIDAAIAAWQTEYSLEDKDVAYIIENVLSVDYDEYKTNAAWAAHMDAKFADFKATIIPLVEDMNAQDALNVSAFEAYKALDDALALWFNNGTTQNTADFVATSDDVNKVNYEIMVKLSAVIEYAKYTAHTETWTDPLKIVEFTYPKTLSNAAAEGITTDKVETIADGLRAFFAKAISWKIPVLVPTEGSDYLGGNYAAIKSYYADPINAAIAAQKALFDAKKLYNTEVLYALKGDMVKFVLTSGVEIYVPQGHVLLDLAAGTEVAMPVPANINSDSVYGKATIEVVKKICADCNYNGLAEVLINEEGLETLLADFDAFVKGLMEGENSSEDFKAALAEVAYVELKASNNGYGRTATTTYAAKDDATLTNTMYYVNLSEKADFDKADAIMKAWLKRGGNVELMKYVPYTVTVSGLEYEAHVYEYVIGNGNTVKYNNMVPQFKLLNDAADIFVKYINAIAKGLADVDYKKASLVDGVVYSTSTSGSGSSATTIHKYVGGYDDYDNDQNHKVALKDLIKIAFEKYAEFEQFNAVLDKNGARQASELYFKNFKADVWANLDEMVTVMIKVAAIADVKTAYTGAGDDATEMNNLNALIADAATVYGAVDSVETFVWNAAAVKGNVAQFELVLDDTMFDADPNAATATVVYTDLDAFNDEFEDGVVFTDDYFAQAVNDDTHQG